MWYVARSVVDACHETRDDEDKFCFTLEGANLGSIVTPARLLALVQYDALWHDGSAILARGELLTFPTAPPGQWR